VGGEIRDSMRGVNRMAQKLRTKRMEPRLPQVAPRRGQTISGGAGSLMGEINRSIEKMSIGENSSSGGGTAAMMNSMADGSVSGAGATMLPGGKLRGGTNNNNMPPQSTLLQNTTSNR
jgi:hypothetical protein